MSLIGPTGRLRRKFQEFWRIRVYIYFHDRIFKLVRASLSEVLLNNPRLDNRREFLPSGNAVISESLVHIPSGSIFLKYNKYENWTFLAESGASNSLTSQGKFGLISKKGKKLQSCDLISIFPTSKNYFHWLLEDALQIANIEASTTFLFNGELTKFQLEFAEILKLKLIEQECRWVEPKKLLFTPKFIFASQPWVDHIEKFRNQVIEKTLLDDNGSKKIYVTRRNNLRPIRDESKLHEHLHTNGFEVVDLQNMSLSKQISIFYNATHVISPHGAALANLIWSRERTKVLEIMSPFFYNRCFEQISSTLHLDYRVCDSYEINEIAKNIDLFLSER
jgi:hypothetical protein